MEYFARVNRRRHEVGATSRLPRSTRLRCVFGIHFSFCKSTVSSGDAWMFPRSKNGARMEGVRAPSLSRPRLLAAKPSDHSHGLPIWQSRVKVFVYDITIIRRQSFVYRLAASLRPWPTRVNASLTRITTIRTFEQGSGRAFHAAQLKNRVTLT